MSMIRLRISLTGLTLAVLSTVTLGCTASAEETDAEATDAEASALTGSSQCSTSPTSVYVCTTTPMGNTSFGEVLDRIDVTCTWNANGVQGDFCQLQYSTNNGSSWSPLQTKYLVGIKTASMIKNPVIAGHWYRAQAGSGVTVGTVRITGTY